MNKKITRRLALGTVIGGLVAAPFVLRHLRINRSIPESAYMKTWRECLTKALSVPVLTKVNPLHDFPLSFRLNKEEGQMKSWTLFGSFQGEVSEVSSETVPIWFTEQKTDFHIKELSPAKSQLGLFVPKTEWVHRSRDSQDIKHQEAVSFGFILDKQSPVKVLLDNGTVYDLPKFDLPMPVATLVNAATFSLPGREVCDVGTCWSVPTSLCYEYPVDCKVVSLAKWGKREVVEVEVMYSPLNFGRCAVLDMIPNEPHFKPFRDQYANLEFRYRHLGKILVDVSTGITVYHCYTNMIETRDSRGKDGASITSSFFANILTFES
jgi:hypothetical protein